MAGRIEKLAAALFPEDPTLVREAREAEKDAVGYFGRHREELRAWGLSSAKGKTFQVTALLSGLLQRKVLGQIDWKEGAAEAREQLTSLLRAFEPATKRPSLVKVKDDLSEAVARWDEQLVAVGLSILQLDNESDQTWFVVAPTERRTAILRAAKSIDGLTVMSNPPAKTRPPALERHVVAKRPTPKAANGKQLARAKAALDAANKQLAQPGGWHEDGHFRAACALIRMGDPTRVRRHIEALIGIYRRKRSIEITLYTIPHLAAAALVDRDAVASWAKRVNSTSAYESLAAAVPKVFGGVSFSPVNGRRLGRNERAYAMLFNACAAGQRVQLIKALEAFDDYAFAGGHQNPIINAVVAVSGLDVVSLPSSVLERMWPGFPP